MDPIIRTVRTPEKSAPLVLRKAALAPIAVLVGAARMKPPPLIEEMTPEHPAPERVAPTEPPPTVDDSARIEAALEEARKLGYAEGFARGAGAAACFSRQGVPGGSGGRRRRGARDHGGSRVQDPRRDGGHRRRRPGHRGRVHA